MRKFIASFDPHRGCESELFLHRNKPKKWSPPECSRPGAAQSLALVRSTARADFDVIGFRLCQIAEAIF